MAPGNNLGLVVPKMIFSSAAVGLDLVESEGSGPRDMTKVG